MSRGGQPRSVLRALRAGNAAEAIQQAKATSSSILDKVSRPRMILTNVPSLSASPLSPRDLFIYYSLLFWILFMLHNPCSRLGTPFIRL